MSGYLAGKSGRAARPCLCPGRSANRVGPAHLSCNYVTAAVSSSDEVLPPLSWGFAREFFSLAELRPKKPASESWCLLNDAENTAGSPPMDDPAHDQAAWLDRAVTRYQSLLQRYALRLVGDAERAQDVVQDTFLKLVRENRADLNGRLAEWLYTVCRNRALDVRRKESRMVALADEAEVEATGRGGESPDAQTKETFATAVAALATLPERQQEIVRLKFEHGLSYQQIASVTGLSVSNVGYLLHTALKTLRQRLAENG